MDTKIIKINENNFSKLQEPAKALADGKLVAFPTETVYGLGANALDENAVKNIFKAKGRPSDNPLIVHICEKSDVTKLAREINENAQKLFDTFSPGPITIILKKQPYISDAVTAGLDTVAVRIPVHKAARELIRMSGVPIAAPSANLSGKPSPTEAKHVIEDMNGRIEYIVDGGSCSVGVESTVVDATGESPVILRPGGVTLDDIRSIIPSATIDPHVLDLDMPNEKPKSPGMKYKHYAPRAEVIVIEGDTANVSAKIQSLCKIARSEGKKIGVMLRCENETVYDADCILIAGETSRQYASNLFSNLRKFDENNVDIIFAEFKNADGMGVAVRNRLYKSAGNNVIYV